MQVHGNAVQMTIAVRQILSETYGNSSVNKYRALKLTIHCVIVNSAYETLCTLVDQRESLI